MDVPSSAEIRRAQVRVAAIREEISARLWRVNAGMSSLMFNDLMDRMAVMQFTCEQRYSEHPREVGSFDRRLLDSLLSPSEPTSDAAPKKDTD
jgi:hypothetical protein